MDGQRRRSEILVSLPHVSVVAVLLLVTWACTGDPRTMGGAAAGGSSTAVGGAPAGGGSAGGASAGGRSGAGGASPTGTGGNRNDAAAAASDAGATVDVARPPEEAGVAPGQIALTATAANGTVGLDWSRVAGATGYRIYWSTNPGVTPQTGQVLQASGPSAVHRGINNGTAYHYVVTAVTAAGEGPPSPPATATPAGEWTLEELGSGDFDDVVTGARVPRLPIDRRIHVLLLAEGYLGAELNVFHEHARHDLTNPTNDVDRWIREVFSIEPYSKLREGFVIWTLPRASTTHSDGGNSAFGVGAPTAAAPLWGALDGEGVDAFPFTPTAATARNFVAAFLLFDPARGRAGVSGHATSCRHPTTSSLSLRCNFGIGHAHEFTHSFSQVRDEYIENNNSLPSASEVSNVAPSNRCDQLPWQHLLAGRGINTTPQLVGAFGRPERGYHSEFRCHMNGTHDNGEAWCGAGQTLTLRPNYLCNHCRELTAFRLFQKTGVIAGNDAAAFATWKATHRAPFFRRFGFQVPPTVPATVMCSGQAAKPVFEDCVP